MSDQTNKLFLDDEQVVLTNEDDEEIVFDCVAEIFHKGKDYVLLDPIDEIEGIEDDEVIILEIVKDADGNDSYNQVDDEKLLDEIWEQYLALEDEYAAANPEECDCEGECDCEECGHEHKEGCDCGCEHKE